MIYLVLTNLYIQWPKKQNIFFFNFIINVVSYSKWYALCLLNVCLGNFLAIEV